MNSLYQQINKPQAINLGQLPNNIQNMISMFKGLSNPQALAQKVINENPQIKSALEIAGGDPEKAFRTMAEKMNVNPDDIINMLK